mgnify:CR=1 FL=1
MIDRDGCRSGLNYRLDDYQQMGTATCRLFEATQDAQSKEWSHFQTSMLSMVKQRNNCPKPHKYPARKKGLQAKSCDLSDVKIDNKNTTTISWLDVP